MGLVAYIFGLNSRSSRQKIHISGSVDLLACTNAGLSWILKSCVNIKRVLINTLPFIKLCSKHYSYELTWEKVYFYDNKILTK